MSIRFNLFSVFIYKIYLHKAFYYMFNKDYSQLQLFLVLKYSLTEATVSKTKKEFRQKSSEENNMLCTL